VVSELAERLSRYINDVFTGFELTGNWSAADNLPLFLQGGYRYQCAHLAGQGCLLMLELGGEQQDSASRLKKHVGIVAKHFHGPVIYVVQATTSYNRKRLIDQRIAFAVPGKQLYLPFAAMDLRESFTPVDASKDKPKRLGAVAQQIVLLALYGRWDTKQSAQALAERLGVSKMTVSRAYSELVDAGLARLEMTGRIKRLVFTAEHRELWALAKPLLTSPIKKRVWIDEYDYRQYAAQLGCLAGESALSELGMLMAPKNKSVALSLQDWTSLKKMMGLREQPRGEDHGVAVELWKYDPVALSERGFDSKTMDSKEIDSGGIVDHLSLYLSLESETDDRVKIAREELLKDVGVRLND